MRHSKNKRNRLPAGASLALLLSLTACGGGGPNDDPDNGGTPASIVDSDSDGVRDSLDAFPSDATETKDSDNDGVGDNADAFPGDSSETTDSDEDGIGNNADAFPNDATETKDSDADGVGDNADAYPNDPTRHILEATTLISGRVFLDINGDGLDNDSNNSIENAIVLLKDANLNRISQTATDDTGAYSFVGVATGQYIVDIEGAPFTTQGSGDSTIDSDVSLVDGSSAIITLDDSQKTATINAGILPSATITVDITKTYQTIRGFGAANTVFNGEASFPNADEIQKAYGMGGDELGLSILRISVPADSNKWPAVSDVAFNAQSLDATVFATPWYAPDDFYDPSNIEHKVMLPSKYTDWVTHLNNYDDYMTANAVDLFAIAIQNEPDIGEWTRWTPEQVLDFTKNYADGLNGKTISAESFNYNRDYYTPIFNDAQALANIDIVGGHIYGNGLGEIPQAVANGKEIWMTEYLLNDQTDFGGGDIDWADSSEQLKWQQSLIMLDTVHRAMESHWNAYIWWYLKRYYSFIGDGEKGEAEGEILKRGYAFSHFAKFIRPGYKRIDISESVSDLDITAYQGDGKIVLQLINTSSSESETLNIAIPNMTLVNGESYTTSLTKDRVNSNITIVDGQPVTKLDASSITTLIFDYTESISLAKTTTQSSNDAVDESNAWWQVDLTKVEQIDDIRIANNLTNFYVFVSENDLTGRDLNDILADATVKKTHISGQAPAKLTIDISATGRFLRVQLADNNVMSLSGVEVFPVAGTQDSDNDTVINSADAFPYNASETSDSDNDGVADGVDAFPNDVNETKDADNDGVGNNADVFPRDASEDSDSDSDGVGDNSDAFPNDATKQYLEVANGVLADTYVRAGGNSSSNYGSDNILATKTGDDNFSRKTLFKLDVSSLENADLVLLTLTPEQVDQGGGTLSYERISDDSWLESDITWDTAPAGSGEIIREVTGYIDETAISIDITSVAKAEAAGDGILSIIVTNPTDKYVSFHSTDSSTASNRPIIHYK